MSDSVRRSIRRLPPSEPFTRAANSHVNGQRLAFLLRLDNMVSSAPNTENPAAHTREGVAALLRRYEIFPTRQRVEIAYALFSHCRHLSAERLLAIVNEQGARTSKATVYNTLNLFVDKKLIREVIVDPDRVFYDPNTAPHHHFYHVDTGELSDISVGEVEVTRLPALPAGTVTDGVDIIVRVRAAR
jgi:Fur family transcriptional regulator, iron response regulator